MTQVVDERDEPEVWLTSPVLRFDPIAEARRHWGDRWPEADRMAAATSVVRVQQIVMTTVEQALRPFDLTFSRYEVLVLLNFSRRGRLPLGKMGVRLQVHPTSVTNAIDRLEAQGFVRRVAEPKDRRLVLAEITTAGRSVIEEATKAVVASQFGLRGLNEEEVALLYSTLLRVRRFTGDFRTED